MNCMNKFYYVIRYGEYIARDIINYDVAKQIATEVGGNIVLMCKDDDGGICCCSGENCLWE